MKIVRSSGKAPNEKLFHHLAQKDFSSETEMKKYLNTLIGKNLDDLGGNEGKTPLDEAQFLIYDAWEEAESKKRLALANKALEISPDCSDAYNLLAEESASSPKEALDLYQEGVAAGKRVLGEKNFRENKGRFWGMHETRPYMRSLAGKAKTYFEIGDPDQGFAIYYEMLDLNPGDNQGIRYELLARHGDRLEFDAMVALLNRYPNDCEANWVFTIPLLSFQKEGDSLRSKEQLHFAINHNPRVADYLLGRKDLPADIPDQIQLGGDSEAQAYGVKFLSLWNKVNGALEWLEGQEEIFRQKKGAGRLNRNDPCLCGSGRKQKKCCGV
ncbi:MAG: SEC-C domain-containing protein [Elusimicrobia bacterium]|nr:SEC-C domain-containing protein [Elusimicrobiota bacterium]